MKSNYLNVRYDYDLDDYDHFKTNGTCSINNFIMDSSSVRLAMKATMNYLERRDFAFIGDVSLIMGFSIERTELIVEHLIRHAFVRKITQEERSKWNLRSYDIVIALN